jgi:hypothetical protein
VFHIYCESNDDACDDRNGGGGGKEEEEEEEEEEGLNEAWFRMSTIEKSFLGGYLPPIATDSHIRQFGVTIVTDNCHFVKKFSFPHY